MTPIRELAERFHEQWLAAHPFAASSYGIPGYDDRVPDDSESGDAAWRSTVEATSALAAVFDRTGSSPADAITYGCLLSALEQERDVLDSAAGEHTVTAMPFSGPAALLAVAARTVLDSEQATSDYLSRLTASADWIDQQTTRLRIGAAKGRLPVAPLVEQAITWMENVLGAEVPAALATPQPPPSWEGRPAWQIERDEIATTSVKPALARWVGLLTELLPSCRPAERPGLIYLPGGDADYERAIRTHTTLPLTADELHRTGLEEIEALEEQMVELGSGIGLGSLAQIHDALRASAIGISCEDAMAGAVQAIRRAEARAGEVFPDPLPPPCVVTAMPTVVGESGVAPHYTPPRLDGGRPGTYWFNVDRPSAGSGWDLEGVAFHEAVPGHHLQLSRIQLLAELPAFQRQRSITVFSEGWGLYAEELAAEMGLYSGTESLLGAATAQLMRAARLVVDTGLHARGWSRQHAQEYFAAHVPLSTSFLHAEVDRYIVMPGQALAYLTGKHEILRLRLDAQQQLGDRFSLRDFHAALLDHGSLPLPILQYSIASWIAAQ